MVDNGRAAEAAQVNWRRITGDAKFDARFIQKAEESGSPTPSWIAWAATGKKDYLERGLTEAVRELLRNRFVLTEAEPPTDRVPLPGNVLLRQMMLGGIGVWVCGWPQMAASWEGAGYDFAALVLGAAPKRIKALAYNFGPARTVHMRVWELERGHYTLRTGPDANRDDQIDAPAQQRELAVDRATRIPLELPADALTVVELSQVRALPAGKRPDLAINAQDLGLSPDRRAVTLTVHNIGGAAAPAAAVVVRGPDGASLGSGQSSPLPAPEDLTPKTCAVRVALAQPAPDRLEAVVDPEGRLEEITKENNRADLDGRRARQAH
jgi:hypothetical protein